MKRQWKAFRNMEQTSVACRSSPDFTTERGLMVGFVVTKSMKEEEPQRGMERGRERTGSVVKSH